MVQYGFHPPLTLSTPTRDVLDFVFAPPELRCVTCPFPSRQVGNNIRLARCLSSPRGLYNRHMTHGVNWLQNLKTINSEQSAFIFF